MLTLLRKAAGTWAARIFFLVLVVAFSGWGISGRISGGFGSNTVLTVGGTSVSATEYRLAYDRQVAILSQQTGSRLTQEQAKAFGVDQQVLAELVNGAILDEQARKLGLGVSKQRIAELTRNDPAFRGQNGQFDRRQFDYILQQVGMRPDDYLKNREQVAVRQQIVEAVSDGLKVPDTFLKAVALYKGEDRTVEYLPLPVSLVQPVEDPSDSTLKSWFDANKKKYAAPEYRKISYVRLDPVDIADPSSISDDQVKQDYEAHKAQYTTQEQRTIQQLTFKNDAAAKAALDAIHAGSTFEDIMKAEGKSEADVTLGTFEKDKVPDKQVADVAFSLKPHEVSQVVEGAFGPVLLRVSDVKPQTTKPLSEVSGDIRKALALNEANRVLLDVHDSYEDARAGGASLKEAADKLKLKVVTIDAVDRRGLDPNGNVLKDIPESDQLLKSAFETEAGVEADPITTKENGFVFFQVDGITPARDRTLQEVHDKAVADWKAEQAESRLGAKAQELLKELKTGKSLDQIAAEVKLEKQTKRGVKRDADDADLGQAGVASVFGVPEGGTGLFTGPDGTTQDLFKVTEVFEPADAGPEAVDDDQRRTYANGIGNDILQELVATLQTQYGVRVDQSAMQRALQF